MIELTLPWPPSVNHYWMRNKNGSVRICQAGIDFRLAAVAAARQKGILPGKPMFTGDVTLYITAFPPDHRRRDADNILKCTLDALGTGKKGVEKANVFVDDCCIQKFTVEKMKPVDKKGFLIVRIESC